MSVFTPTVCGSIFAMRLRAVTAIVPLLWLGCCVVSGLPDDEEAAGGELRTDKTLMINEGEGSLDIYDEGFVYNHNQSMMSCPPETENQLADPSEFGVGCWPLGRLLLHPEEHAGSVRVRFCRQMCFEYGSCVDVCV